MMKIHAADKLEALEPAEVHAQLRNAIRVDLDEKNFSISLSDARNEPETETELEMRHRPIGLLPPLLVTEQSQRAVNTEHCTYDYYLQEPFEPLRNYPNVDFPNSFWFADVLFGDWNLCDVARNGIEAKHNADLDAFDNSLYLEYLKLKTKDHRGDRRDRRAKRAKRGKNQTNRNNADFAIPLTL